MKFVLVIGTTRTARIPGISAAGADPTLIPHTPIADAEILEHGRPISTPHVPVSPTGCPTPAVITRAVRDVIGFDTLTVTAGLATEPALPTRWICTTPGNDIRESTPVPNATPIVQTARAIGRTIPDQELLIAESIPGGTTTALGVLAALGEPFMVSSSLKTNPIAQKRAIVTEGLAASGIARGECRKSAIEAIQLMGDPVQAAISGLSLGALETGRTVTLAGGSQMIAIAAILRHLGLTDPLTIATTSFVATDMSTAIQRAADAFSVTLAVTDPAFETVDHPVMNRYRAGEAKEGVGMGGALMLADRSAVSMEQVHDRIITRYKSLVTDDGS